MTKTEGEGEGREREREREKGGGKREREKVRLGAWVINLIIKKGGEGGGLGGRNARC